MRLLVSLSLSSVLLSGCSWFYGETGVVHDTRRDYIQAKQEQPLQMPEDVKGYRPENYFEVPAITASSGQKVLGDELDVAPPALVLATAEGVHAVQEKEIPTAIRRKMKTIEILPNK